MISTLKEQLAIDTNGVKEDFDKQTNREIGRAHV